MYRKTCMILNRLLDTRVVYWFSSRDSEEGSSTFSYVFAYRHQIATIFRSLVVGANRSAKLNRIQRIRASNRAVRCIATANYLLFGRGADGPILAILRRAALCEDLRQKEVRGVLPHASDDKSSAVQFHSRRVADANTRCILSQCSIVLSASRRLEKHTERRNWKLKLESVLSRSLRLIRRRSRFYFFSN